MSLVPVLLNACPSCGSPVDRRVLAEPALLTHGGYGATRTTTTLACRCGWDLVVDVTERRPPGST